MQLDWVKKAGKKATPLFVHFLMIVSVGAYAIFGALVMRNLESKTVTTVEKTTELTRRHITEEPPLAPKLLQHRRRRRHNETMILEETESIRAKRAAAHIMRSRKCVITVIKKMSSLECSMDTLDEKLVKQLDECYHVAIEHNTHVNHVLFTNSHEQVESVGEESEEQIEEWSFMDSLLFAFTVITTIGYGNVAPRTFGGRLFVIGYGLIGIPFTLLAIADLGKFISEMMTAAKGFVRKTWKKLKKAFTNSKTNPIWYPKSNKSNGDIEEKILEEDRPEGVEEENEATEEEEELSETEALSLFILFLVYIAFGGIMLAAYEPDMDFFKAVYFNFVTLTSIGLGDIVPRSETYMLITIVYIAIGLALTTIAIEIAADALKKLHYFGRKIENVGNVAIWFGGKKITMKALVKNLGDQFNLPTTVIKSLNLDHFVDQAIRVEEGEIETLRPPPFEPSPDEFEADFADDADAESVWIRDPTPTPPPTPPSPTPVYRMPSIKKPSPEPPKRSPSPSEKSLAVETPSPEESEDEELILPSPEPSPEPTPREPTAREPTPEPEPEPPREPTPPPPPPPKPRPLTAAEIAAQKRKAYSEEAWRRYQEYQKQWKKFRQTQKTPGASSSGGASTSKVKTSSGTSPEGGTASSTRSQSIASIHSSRSATPDSKKASLPTSSRGEHK